MMLTGLSDWASRRLAARARTLRVMMMLAAAVLLRLPAEATEHPFISELQSSNRRTYADEDGDATDWVELWNPGAAPFDLSGCGLSDSAHSPFKWVFATNAVLRAGERMVVFASGKDRQPVPAGTLAPTNVPGLAVWLRADAVDPADSGQVQVIEGAVFLTEWRDASGQGNHAAAASGGQAPQWIAPTPDTPATVRFDGVDDLLRWPNPAGTNDFCLFAVCRTAQAHEVDPESNAGVGGVSGQRWLFGVTHGGDFDAGAGVSIGTNGISVYEHGSGYMPALLTYERPIGSDLQVLAVNYDNHLPSLDIQGLAVRTGVASLRREVWAPVEMGAGAYGAFKGDLLEVLVYRRSLTEDERRGVARYLADRHGITLPLPRHTNFQLSASGEEVVLTSPDGTLLDQVKFGAVPEDVSYGRSSEDPSQWRFFATPTPGLPNDTPGATEWLAAPEFSHPGGFFSNQFELALTNPNEGGEIRLTLNGAEPATNSALYLKPIAIRSRIGTPNNLSAIPTVPGGQPPSGEVFKGWVVRARVFKPNAMPSPVVTRTFWIDSRGAARYSLPVVALSTDHRNFFDPDIGIYVPGNAPGGNYSQRGTAWERPVHVELYETTGQMVLDQEGDVKIHGNTSQGFPIKGLDLDATGGAGRQPFRYRFFPDRDRAEFEHILLRPSGHDHYMAFMRDEMMQSLGAETGAESQAARPCVVFLNGEYWGLHYLKEKEDEDFVSYYGKTPVKSLDYLEGYAAAKAGDTRHYDAMVQFMAANDPALPANYAQIQSWMEVPNYIDYKVFEIFEYRWDIGNHRLWRPHTPDGRWRWLQFDNDVGWGGFWAEQPAWAYNMLAADLSVDGRLNGHNNEVTTFLLRRLMLNPDFQRDFLNRFADLLNTVLLPTNTLAHIDGFAAALAPEMAEHCQRWLAPASLTAWQNAVEYLREYARRRPDFCRQHLQACFKLPGDAALSLSVDPPASGRLRLNSLELGFVDHARWQGRYFLGNPIHLTALPEPGYRFVGWAGLPGVITNRVQVMLHGDWAVTAQFAPSASVAARLQVQTTAPGGLRVLILATPGTQWVLQQSRDLHDWLPVATVTLNAQGVAEVSVQRESGPACYYRACQP